MFYSDTSCKTKISESLPNISLKLFRSFQFSRIFFKLLCRYPNSTLKFCRIISKFLKNYILKWKILVSHTTKKEQCNDIFSHKILKKMRERKSVNKKVTEKLIDQGTCVFSYSRPAQAVPINFIIYETILRKIYMKL